MIHALLLVATVSLSGSPLGVGGGMRLGCEACVPLELVAQAPGAREAQLKAEIAELDTKIGAIGVAWPTGALIKATIGYFTAPVILLGLPLLLVGVAWSASGEAGGPGLMMLGGVFSAVGVAGLVLMIWGIMEGVEGSNAAKTEKDALRERRRSLREELYSLQQSARLEGPPSIVLAGLRF
ncbi:MAG: hypothetical protein P1V51_08510 [Deltaproteobacteria bacterium]|nr:hypothetical protein [Deltaproteobacteria bacterium]